MTYVPNELLGRLVDMRLLSVEFILDYVVLRFDGDAAEPNAMLSCDVMPHVEASDGTRLRDGQSGYVRTLRSLVGHDVTATSEGEGAGRGLRVEIASRGAVVLDPAMEELNGPEIAMLSGFPDDAWMVWRPGEEAFEHLA